VLRHAVYEDLTHFLHQTESGRPTRLGDVLGPDISARLAAGLQLLVGHFTWRGLEGAQLVGPTLEGVGMYPIHDDTLATKQPALWVAGDVAGTFRGLTAALVSGNVAGQAIVEAQGS